MLTRVGLYSSNSKYSYSYSPTHKSGLKSLNKFNPIAHYMNDYFTRMARISNTRFRPIISELKNIIKNVTVKSGNQSLVAWDMNPNNSDKYILFLHGMAQNITDYQDLYKSIIDQGDYGLLALEYRSYGLNKTGKATEDNLLKDSKSGLKYLKKEKKIQTNNIIIAGHSMGGSLATNIASKEKGLKALLLISPLTKTDYLGKKFSQNSNLGIGIPNFVQNLTEKLKPLKFLYGLSFNSIDKIKKVKCPIYLLHSKNDTVTSLQGVRNLVKMALRNDLQIKYYYPQLGGHKVDKRKIELVTEILNNIK